MLKTRRPRLWPMKPQQVDNRPISTSDRVIYIDAKPDSKVVHLSIDIELNDLVFTRQQMTLRREMPEEAVARQ